jgi:hypothetical protein
VTEQPQSPEPATEVQEAADTPQVTPTAATPEAAPAASIPDPAPVAAATEPAVGAPVSGAYSGESASVAADASWTPSDSASEESGGPAALLEERPEIAVGAAFAGGFVLAMILKRLAR